VNGVEKINSKMICIPAGPFLYGEEKVRIDLPEFWISSIPVTNAPYAEFIEATGYRSPDHWHGIKPPEQIANHPVVHVSWFDVLEFAQWAGKRIPSEEEWEKAARGTDGRAYPWGEWKDGCCNTKEAGLGRTNSVLQYSPQGDSPYGSADIAGNVFEWTATMEGKYHILRGGSFNHGREMATCTFRVRHKPSYRFKNIGFRLCGDKE
jgi:formylglycine-generating enzyme required for sulfatase activity